MSLMAIFFYSNKYYKGVRKVITIHLLRIWVSTTNRRLTVRAGGRKIISTGNKHKKNRIRDQIGQGIGLLHVWGERSRGTGNARKDERISGNAG